MNIKRNSNVCAVSIKITPKSNMLHLGVDGDRKEIQEKCLGEREKERERENESVKDQERGVKKWITFEINKQVNFDLFHNCVIEIEREKNREKEKEREEMWREGWKEE